MKFQGLPFQIHIYNSTSIIKTHIYIYLPTYSANNTLMGNENEETIIG